MSDVARTSPVRYNSPHRVLQWSTMLTVHYKASRAIIQISFALIARSKKALDARKSVKKIIYKYLKRI